MVRLSNYYEVARSVDIEPIPYEQIEFTLGYVNHFFKIPLVSDNPKNPNSWHGGYNAFIEAGGVGTDDKEIVIFSNLKTGKKVTYFRYRANKQFKKNIYKIDYFEREKQRLEHQERIQRERIELEQVKKQKGVNCDVIYHELKKNQLELKNNLYLQKKKIDFLSDDISNLKYPLIHTKTETFKLLVHKHLGIEIYKGLYPIQSENVLIIPINDLKGNIVNFQVIDDKGIKLFLKGLFFGVYPIIERNNDFTSGVVGFCEGVATGITINFYFGIDVICCLSCVNFSKIKDFIKIYPHNEIMIYADYDTSGVGQSKALELQKEIKEQLAIDIKVKTIKELKCFLRIQELAKRHNLKITDYNDILILQQLIKDKNE